MFVTLLALLSLLCNHGNADLTTALSDSSVHVGDDVTFVCAYQFQNQTGDDDDDMDNYAMNYDFNLIHLSGFKPTIKEGHYTEQVVATVNITGGLTSVMGGEQVTSSAELQADYRKVTLTLHNLTFEDYGEYQCGVGDRGVFRGNVVLLKIIGPPRIIKDATVQHLSKFPARTCCVFESFPPPSMSSWTLPSGQTVLDARMAPSDWNQIVWSTNYLIPAYNSSHVGKYRCTVVNPFGRDSFEFLVNDDTFVRIEEDTDVVKLRVNDMKLVRCLAANLNASIPKEKYSFFWTLRSGQQNMTIANSSTQSVRTYLSFNISEGDSTSAMFVLVINHVDFSWDGELTCQMSVDGSNFTSTVRLQVTGLPDVESPINRFYTNLNTSQQIVCQVTSFPPPSEYSWRFALDHSIAHKFTTITAQPGKYQISVRDDINGHLMILTIFNINQSDIGIYQCSSTNELGESYDFVEIEFCDSGYTPMIGGIECKDINECKEFNDICDYLCKNLNGSYTCECPEGRALNSDKRSCLALDYEELQERIGQGIGLGAGAVLVLVLVFGGVAYYYRYRSKKKRRDSFMNIVHERAKKTRSQIMLKQSQSDITIKRLSERKFPLDQTRINEFPRERLRVLDQLGKGEFGCVCMAEALNIIGTGKWEVVAVKMAHESATDLEKIEFVRELDLMSRIPRHLNVVNYLGCCSLIDPVMIIMEYISGGDLQTFLRQRRRRDFFLELSSPQHNREHLSFGDDPRGHGVNHMSFINPGFTHDNQQQLNYQQSNNQQFNSPERNISTKKCLAPTRSADSVNYIKNSTSPHHRTDPAGHGSIQKKKNSAHRLRSDTISLIRIDSTSDTASSHGDDSLPDTPVRHSEINFSTSGGMSEPRSEPQPDCDVTDGSRQAEVRENDLHENGHRKLRLTNSCPTPSPVKQQRKQSYVTSDRKPAYVTSDTISLSSRSRQTARRGSMSSQCSSVATESCFSRITSIDEVEEERISSSDLFAFCLQVARGMGHLAENKIVHRDLAARNVLVTDRGVCKITDFGLARCLGDTDHYDRSSKGPLPVRWLAPESLIDRTHSTKSDVWAYGILLWEIVTLGASPYPGLSAHDVFKFVSAGNPNPPTHNPTNSTPTNLHKIPPTMQSRTTQLPHKIPPHTIPYTNPPPQSHTTHPLHNPTQNPTPTQLNSHTKSHPTQFHTQIHPHNPTQLTPIHNPTHSQSHANSHPHTILQLNSYNPTHSQSHTNSHPHTILQLNSYNPTQTPTPTQSYNSPPTIPHTTPPQLPHNQPTNSNPPRPQIRAHVQLLVLPPREPSNV